MSTLYEISSLTAYVMSQPNMFSQVIGVVSKGDKIDVFRKLHRYWNRH